MTVRRPTRPKLPRFQPPRPQKAPRPPNAAGLPKGSRLLHQVQRPPLQPWQAPPATWPVASSRGEWAVYWCLTIPLHLREHYDFEWQGSFLGGRLQLGGFVPDFVIYFANVAINVDSLIYHAQSTGQEARDVLQTVQVAARGLTLIHLWELDLVGETNPLPLVQQALRGQQPPTPIT